MKLLQNLTCSFGEDFLRISSCPYSARSSHSPEPCLWTDEIFGIIFEMVTQGTFLSNYFKVGPGLPEKKIFKELPKKLHFVTMASRVFDGIKFCEQFLKRTSQGAFLPSLVQICPTVWDEKIFKEIVVNARLMTDTR